MKGLRDPPGRDQPLEADVGHERPVLSPPTTCRASGSVPDVLSLQLKGLDAG